MQGATASTALNLVLSLHTNMEFVFFLGASKQEASSSELSTYLTVIGLLSCRLRAWTGSCEPCYQRLASVDGGLESNLNSA